MIMAFSRSFIIWLSLVTIVVGQTQPAPPGTRASPGVELQACVESGMYALTFDDGPTEVTMAAIDTLNRHGVKGTFFVLGQRMEQYPDTFKTAYADGHLVASHSYSHPHFPQLSVEQMRDELDRTANLFHQLVGVKPRYFRAPYGEINDVVVNLLKEYQYNLIYWNLDCHDWEGYDETAIVNTIGSQLDSGSPSTNSWIDVKHDRIPATVNALENIINLIQSKGYRIVPMTDCVGDTQSPYTS